MPDPAQNPLQPLVNQIAALVCQIKTLITVVGGDSGGTPAIYFTPAKGDVANYGPVTIGTTPTLICTANRKRANFCIVNGGVATVYIGSDNRVTTNTGAKQGLELLANATMDNDTYTGEVWGVVAVGTAMITKWEEFST
jgi:hypothetical protein